MQEDKSVVVEEQPIASEEQIEAKQESNNDQQQVNEQKKDSDRNWSETREVLRLQKQRIEDLETRLAQQPRPKQEEQDEFDKLDPEDYVTVGKAKELAKKLAAKEAAHTAKQVVQEYIQQQQVMNDEQRMRAKHEDFDYVIENFAVPMIKNDPALAYKIQSSRNPAEAAYKLAKISDEYEASMTKQTSPRAEKVIKNSSKPVSAASVSPSLKSQVEDYSKMDKNEIWRMNQEYARRA